MNFCVSIEYNKEQTKVLKSEKGKKFMIKWTLKTKVREFRNAE